MRLFGGGRTSPFRGEGGKVWNRDAKATSDHAKPAYHAPPGQAALMHKEGPGVPYGGAGGTPGLGCVTPRQSEGRNGRKALPAAHIVTPRYDGGGIVKTAGDGLLAEFASPPMRPPGTESSLTCMGLFLSSGCFGLR